MAAPRANHRARPGLRPSRPRKRSARGLGAQPDGAASAPDSRVCGSALQWSRAATDFHTLRRKLWLARLPRRGHGADRGPADLDGAASAPKPVAPSQPAAHTTTRGTPRGQPQVPKRSQRAARRASAARALRVAARIPGGSRRLQRRTTAPTARRAPRRGLSCAPHGHPAARLPALCRRAGHAARGRHVSSLLLTRRALPAPARGRRALSRHDGPALRRLGAAPRPIPDDPRWRRVGSDAPSEAPRRPVRSRPFQIPREPAGWRRAPDPRAYRGAARAGRHDLSRARKTARPRRRAHFLSRPRRRTDRLGLRDDDGLPAGDGDRPVGGGQGPEEARCAHRGRSGSPPR